MRLLRSKVTFSHFSDFGAQKSLLGEKVTFERKSDFRAPGTRKWTNISLVFKGLRAIGANGDFRRRRNDFRGRFYGKYENVSGISKKTLFENAKTRPDFRAAWNHLVLCSENRTHLATFRKNAKMVKFPLF